MPRCRRLAFVASVTAVAAVAACASHATVAASLDSYPDAQWSAATSLEELGWSAARVDALRGLIDSVGSSAFMIVTRGQVVAAWGDTSGTFLTHSIRKSFMSALIGIAVAEGRLDTSSTLRALGIKENESHLTDAELQARVVDLLRARSGVYLAAAGEVDAMRAARPPRGSHAPGSFWYYNNWDFNVLGTIYRKATGRDIFVALDELIARPIGMQDYRPQSGQYYVEEPSEHPGYIFRISARDLARFGHLYLQRGRWKTRQMVPSSWIDASVRSYSTTGDQGSMATKSGYGFMWWIQANAEKHPGLAIPNGAHTASGNGGQRLTVIPAIRTVIVNLMNTDSPGPRIGSNQWDMIVARVMAARLP
jgi:CubicO group peptidase (beta-lactamase class C family)